MKNSTPLMKKFMSEAGEGHFGICQTQPFSEEVLAEAKGLGCYIPNNKTINWGEFRVLSTFADRLYHIAYTVHHS